MGCIYSREVSSQNVVRFEVKREISSSNLSNRKVDGDLEKEVARLGSDSVEELNGASEKEIKAGDDPYVSQEIRKSRPKPRPNANLKQSHREQAAAGWPPWLTTVCGEALNGLVPRRADSFEKIEKIGQGTYSNVYKAKDTLTGKIVALKKVRFDNAEPESVKFMAREIHILRQLDHPNVIRLEGIVTSRMGYSLYLVFEYMDHDLAGLAANPEIKFTEPQVKCFMHQLLSGLEHCHNHGVLHRDIKGSNLLIDSRGVLKIADFGLASFFDPNHKHPMTSRVVTLWYRPPELLLGATDYDVGVDLWSAGCIIAELLARRPILPGRNEVEQLHKIYKLCGSPSNDYWKRAKLPNATLFKPPQPYKRCFRETFTDFPSSSFPLIETLLAIDPAERKTATIALKSEFFMTKPYGCEPSSLPKFPPSKEIDAKRRDDEARRLRAASKAQGDGAKQKRSRGRAPRPIPAPEAKTEFQPNMDRRRLITHGNGKSKSDKFPPPHLDGEIGFPYGYLRHNDPANTTQDIPFSTTSFGNSKDSAQAWSGPLINPSRVGASRLNRQQQQQQHRGGNAQEPSKGKSLVI